MALCSSLSDSPAPRPISRENRGIETANGKANKHRGTHMYDPTKTTLSTRLANEKYQNQNVCLPARPLGPPCTLLFASSPPTRSTGRTPPTPPLREASRRPGTQGNQTQEKRAGRGGVMRRSCSWGMRPHDAPFRTGRQLTAPVLHYFETYSPRRRRGGAAAGGRLRRQDTKQQLTQHLNSKILNLSQSTSRQRRSRSNDVMFLCAFPGTGVFSCSRLCGALRLPSQGKKRYPWESLASVHETPRATANCAAAADAAAAAVAAATDTIGRA